MTHLTLIRTGLVAVYDDFEIFAYGVACGGLMLPLLNVKVSTDEVDPMESTTLQRPLI